MTRRKTLGNSFSGWTHLAVIYAICLAGILGAAAFLSSVTWLELLMIPVAILISNLVEYSIHRWPMHQTRKMEQIYKQHSGDHHVFFTNKFMQVGEWRDLKVSITKTRVIVMFFTFILFPLAALFSLVSLNLGLIFFISAVSYYLVYEMMHLISHLPDGNFLKRLPYIRGCVHRHTVHHNTRLMHKWNFNVMFPLFDVLFGTLHKSPK